MATPVLIPVSEYLRTTYDPDRDYLDGELKERNLGERPHGLLQGIFFTIFQANRRRWRLLPIIEQRVQTGVNRFRIPDICLVHPQDSGNIVRTPPVLCVEILSKDDTVGNIKDRLDDYLTMGVETIWIIDPWLRLAYQTDSGGLKTVTENLIVPGTEVLIQLKEVFQELDDLLAGRI